MSLKKGLLLTFLGHVFNWNSENLMTFVGNKFIFWYKISFFGHIFSLLSNKKNHLLAMWFRYEGMTQVKHKNKPTKYSCFGLSLPYSWSDLQKLLLVQGSQLGQHLVETVIQEGFVSKEVCKILPMIQEAPVINI